jgi:hypothetical protein
MSRASCLRLRSAAVILVAAGAALAACRGVDPPILLCTYAGTQHPPGASFPASDGCNTCTCGDDATVACTEKACLDAAPPIAGPDGPMGDAAVTDAARPDTTPAPLPPPPPGPDAGGPGPDVAPDGSCAYGGAVYRAGDSFPAEDGCNTCTCLSNGGVGCTRKACPPQDAGPTCDVSTRYEYGEVGGLRIAVQRSVVEPGNRYTRTRSPVVGNGPVLSCAPPLPRCGTFGAITAAELEAAFRHPDVQAALAEATPPVYGRDLRPVDDTVLEVKRADGRGFLVGAGCNAPIGCRNIPAGIVQISRQLRDLDRQQLAAPECQGLR